MEIKIENEELVIPYNLLLENTNWATVLVENALIIYANQKAMTILGASSVSQLVGVNFIYFMKFNDYELEEEKVVVNDNFDIQNKEIEISLTDMQGKEKLISYYMNKIKIGERSLTLVNFEDVSTKLIDIKEGRKFKQVVEQSPVQIIITDLKGRIEYANPCFVERMGYSLDEIIGKKMSEFKSGEQDKSIYQELWATIAAGEVWKGLLKNRSKSGEIFVDSVRISTIRNKDGIPANYLAVEEDVTEKVDMVKTLNERAEELKKLDSELSDAQNQLIQREKLAGIGQLAAGVAHEINNPLGFIISNTSTLKNYTKKFIAFTDLTKQLLKFIENSEDFERDATIDALKEMDKKYELDYIIEDFEDLFSDMDEGLGRVKKIVNGLRMFSRVDQTDELIEYDLNDGIRDTLAVVNNELKFDAKIELDLDKTIPFVMANGGQMNQVILNLLINAVHSIRSKEMGMGNISIKTGLVNEFVECTIKDTGTGIEKEVINKIFDPFFTTKPAGVGTGLGLSISYDIITNKHSGYLNVESEVGVGSTFSIVLPTNNARKDS